MKRCLPVLLFLLSFNAHGTLNKWVDDEGKVHYSDQPPPPNVKAQILIAPAAGSGTPPQKSIAERESERKKALKAKEEAAQKAAQQQESDLAKQKNCEGAKSNLRTLESNSQIATYNDKGERINMDYASRQRSLEEASKQVSTFCN